MTAKRGEVVPEDWVAHLQATIPGFKHEAVAHQIALARLVWLGSAKRRQHQHFEGAMSFHYQELDEVFGRGQFKKMNERLGFFTDSGQWFHGAGMTKGYWLADQVKVSRSAYLAKRWRKVTRLLMADGEVLRTIPPAVASRDMNNITTTAWRNARELNTVRVDLQALQRLRNWLDDVLRVYDSGMVPHDLVTEFPPRDSIERLAQAAAQVIRMAKTDVAGHGFVAHRYVQAASGRLYAKGINLQTAPSLIKQAALAGLWEYDFSNCHFTLLAQMAARHGYQCEAIAHYLNHKKATRQAIAAKAGITEAQAKLCLLAVMYGARASEWHENAIPEAIGQEAAARLLQVEQFKAISADVAQARKTILKHWPRRTSNGRLTNDFGRAIDDKASPAERLAHLLQGVEAKALKAAIDLYPRHICLVQHDGFAAAAMLDCSAIEQAVLEATGYRLELEEKQIQADPDAYFLSRF